MDAKWCKIADVESAPSKDGESTGSFGEFERTDNDSDGLCRIALTSGPFVDAGDVVLVTEVEEGTDLAWTSITSATTSFSSYTGESV